MKNIIKSNKFTLLFLIVSLIFSMFLFSTTFVKAKAETPPETSDEVVAPNSFYMVSGAQIRTRDPMGLRFKAILGKNVYNELVENVTDGSETTLKIKDNKRLGMFIVPDVYYDNYKDYKVANDYQGNFYSYCKDVVGKILDYTYSADQIAVYEDGYSISGAVVNILFNNTNLKFNACAYIETRDQENNLTYQFISSRDNARSVAYVAGCAIDAGETNGREYFELTQKNAGYNALGVVKSGDKYLYNGSEYNSLIDIKDNPLSAYQITSEDKTINVGESYQVLLNNNFSSLNVKWSSDNSTVASVENGTVTAHSAGSAVITAKSGIIERSVNITVEEGQITCVATDVFDPEYPEDVVCDVDLKGGAFTSVTAPENYHLTENDYTFNGDTNKLTIKKDYLLRVHTLKLDKLSLTLNSGNKSLDFEISVPNAQNKVVNSGFETGDLYGWNSYSIWKDEVNMVAWVNDRVVNGKYFDNKFDYNREGNFNLGIHGNFENGNYKGVSKDSGQERMGILRSSDFVLGGSGVVSVMLGGGRTKSFNYLSVMDADTNTEVARTFNKNFNKKINGVENTEARLFRYYIDLSDHIGKTLYFVLYDGSSKEWAVMSADSFRTYYPEKPVLHNNDEKAADILPVINLAGNSTNAILNGNFDNNMEGWNNVDNVVKKENDYIISNGKSGDADVGIIRSSAFKVDGENKCLFFDFGGGLKYDKQIFVSIREVGSNREVIRLVRRDNLGGEARGNLDKHWVDLSTLDSTKEYYLEFADNVNAGWGIFKVKSVRLEKNKGIDGDKAVVINMSHYFDYSTGKLSKELSNYFTYIAPEIAR